jgi:large subunit ribosomal protein L32
MAVPKRKTSKSRIRTRRAAHDSKRRVATAKACPQCGAAQAPHRACKSCGTYRGRQVLTISAD